MFYKVFGCIHACILHVLSVRLTRDFSPYSDFWTSKMSENETENGEDREASSYCYNKVSERGVQPKIVREVESQSPCYSIPPPLFRLKPRKALEV